METREEMKNRFKAYRQSLYDQYPEVDRFVKRKSRFLSLLLIICLIQNFTTVLGLKITMEASIGVFIMAALVRIGTQLIFILAAMTPRWQISLGLYIMAVDRIANYIRQLLPHLENYSIQDIFNANQAIIARWPWMGFAIILEPVLPVLTLFTAMWLTIPAKNRRYAEKSEEINKKFMEFISKETK
ncbi:hypothetical protein AALB16_15990 [Lachnospiraceae bacterium 62-35]